MQNDFVIQLMMRIDLLVFPNSGVVFDGEHLHHLEPFWSRDLNDSVSGLSRWETLHYRQGDLRRNFTCGKKKYMRV